MVRVPGRRKNPHNIRVAEQAREKALQGLELRKAGVTYEKVSGALGYSSASSAKRAIDRLLLRQETDAASEVIMMDLQRLDEYMQRCTNALRQNADLSQIDRLLRITEAKYRLLGIGDESMRQLREQYGVTTAIDSTTNVMIVQTSQSSEEEFIKKMMQAVQIPVDNPDAVAYIKQRAITSTPHHPFTKAAASKKNNKKKIVVRKKKTVNDVLNVPHNVLAEQEIIDAEIV